MSLGIKRCSYAAGQGTIYNFYVFFIGKTTINLHV